MFLSIMGTSWVWRWVKDVESISCIMYEMNPLHLRNIQVPSNGLSPFGMIHGYYYYLFIFSFIKFHSQCHGLINYILLVHLHSIDTISMSLVLRPCPAQPPSRQSRPRRRSRRCRSPKPWTVRRRKPRHRTLQQLAALKKVGEDPKPHGFSHVFTMGFTTMRS